MEMKIQLYSSNGFTSERVKNNVEKGENAHYQQFFLFQKKKGFQRLLPQRFLKLRLYGEGPLTLLSSPKSQSVALHT